MAFIATTGKQQLNCFLSWQNNKTLFHRYPKIQANPDNAYFCFQRKLMKLFVIIAKQILMCTAWMKVLFKKTKLFIFKTMDTYVWRLFRAPFFVTSIKLRCVICINCVYLLVAIECDSNLLDGKCHLGIIQLKLRFIKFSFLCDMNESSSRFGTPKTFDEEKDCLSILFQNLRLHEQMGVADFSRMARPKALKICTI